MLLQSSLDTQIANISMLAEHSTNARPNSVEEMTQGYRKFLSSCRPAEMDQIRLEFGAEIVTEPRRVRRLGSIFTSTPATELDDLNQLDVFKESENIPPEDLTVLKGGLDAFQGICPAHAGLLQLIISEIIVLPSTIANGGSTSQALGIIWANPSKSWRVVDAMEFLLHELTHHCMFIDELCNEHYEYKTILKKQFWSDSTILNRARPIDKVLHSIVVSTEILLLRENLISHPASPRCHPPSSIMAIQLTNAIGSLWNMATKNKEVEILKPRALDLLQNCERLSKKINTSGLEC